MFAVERQYLFISSVILWYRKKTLPLWDQPFTNLAYCGLTVAQSYLKQEVNVAVMHLSQATSSSYTNYAKITLVIPVLSDLETWRQSYISLTTKVAIDDKLEEFERAWELLRGGSRCRGARGDKEYQVENYVVTFSGFYIRFAWKDFVK